MWSYRHRHFTVHQLPALRDNYVYLIDLHDDATLVAVDPADAAVVNGACAQLGKPLTHIFNTHHHWDHTDGNRALQAHFQCRVIGNRADQARIPGIDWPVTPDTPPRFGPCVTTLFDLPGHTIGHIALLIDDALFCGDTLFGAGCGRIFEGTPAQMWQSLTILAALPPTTQIYCAHEYTLPNLHFARTIEPQSEAIRSRLIADKASRRAHRPTIPSSLASELVTNPFLRPRDSRFCRDYAGAHQIDSDPLTIFTHIRQRKDHF